MIGTERAIDRLALSARMWRTLANQAAGTGRGPPGGETGGLHPVGGERASDWSRPRSAATLAPVRGRSRRLRSAGLLLALLASAGCDRTLDPQESGSLALGQNLYRSGQLEWWAPPGVSAVAEARAATWRATVHDLTVTGPASGAGDPSAGRLVVTTPSEEARALLEAHGVGWEADELVAGAWRAPAEECAVVATLEDPLRHRLPLTLITATSDARLAEAVRQVVPGWRREVVVLRAGTPWLWLDLEGEEPAALLCVRPLREEAVVEHQAPEGPWEALTSSPGIPSERARGYAVAAAAAAARAGLDLDAGWTLHLTGTLEPLDPGGIRESVEGTVDPVGRAATWCAADARIDRFARTFVARLLRHQRPAEASWRIDAEASRAVGWDEGPRFQRAASHPARPSAPDLLDDAADARLSELLLGPLRAGLLRHAEERFARPRAVVDEFLELLPSAPERAEERRPAPRSSVLLSARDGLGTPAVQELLARTRAAGLRAVGLTFDLTLDDDPGFGRAYRPEQRLRVTGGDAALRMAAAHARQEGLSVQLWPTVLSSRTGGPVGREVRVFPDQRAELFDELEAALTHATLLAQDVGADWCSLGHRLGEVASTSQDLLDAEDAFGREARAARAAGWERVLRAARAGFEGGLVLCVPEPGRVAHVGFAQELDAIGCNLFPVIEGLDQGQVRGRRLLPLMRERLAPAVRACEELGVPLWVAPVGFRARHGAGRGPGLEAGEEEPARRIQLLEAVNGAVRERGATLSVWKVTPTPDAHHGLGTDGELQLLGRFLAP